MALRADLSTARVDPFRRDKTLNVNFFIHDPITGEQYPRDPRNVAKKAEAYLASTGIADTAYFGPEAEFYRLRLGALRDLRQPARSTRSTPRRAPGTPVRSRTTAVTGPLQGGYFPAPPVDHFADLRAEISLSWTKNGLQVERQHHEVGTAGQAEINYKFNTLLAAADDLMLFKYIVKNVAWRNGKTATFMPKPIFGRQRLGHARPPVPVGRRRAALSTTSRATRASRTWRATLHRRHPEARPVCCSPSPTRR